MSRVQSLLSKDVSKNRMTQREADEALARINPVKGDGSGLNGDEKLNDVDIVIEVRAVQTWEVGESGNSDVGYPGDTRAQTRFVQAAGGLITSYFDFR